MSLPPWYWGQQRSRWLGASCEEKFRLWAFRRAQGSKGGAGTLVLHEAWGWVSCPPGL